MENNLSKVLEDLKLNIEDNIITEVGRSFVTLSPELMDLVSKSIAENAFYRNNLQEFTQNTARVRFRDRVGNNWATVDLLVVRTEQELNISINLVGYDTVTKDGGYITTDSIKSKNVLGW